MAKRFRIEYRLYSPTAPSAYVTAPDNEVGSDADSLNLSFKHNGYANYDTAATTTFTIRADFYAFVYYWLWEDAQAVSNSIECRIYDYVCEKYLYGEYYIKQGGIQFCKEECTLKVSAKHEDLTYKCLQNTLVDTDQATNPDAAHNWFSGGMLHPEFGYCRNNQFIYGISLLALAMTILSPIGIFVILPLLIFGVLDNLYERARGCDRKLPSPLITTYLENLTDNCNTTLTDTVFTNPSKIGQLENACIFFAPVQKGLDLQDNTTLYSLTNALNYSGKKFLEFLQKRFNLKWRVNPNELIIHHFDESYSPTVLLDLTDVPDVCCEWTGIKPPSYGNYDFTLDTLDTEGNASRRAYNDIVEFNSPYSLAQDGELRRTFEDAAVGFRNDGLRSDDISQIEQWFAPVTALLALLNVLPDADDFVYTSQYTTSAPKIIIWDGVNKHNAKAIKKSFSANEIAVLSAEGYDPASMGSQYGENTYFYNYVMPCNAELNAFTPNTYPLFECDNVRVCPCRKEQLCKFTIPTCDCDILDVLGIYENTTTGAIIDYPVRMDSETIGEIQGIDIDFGNDTIVLTVKPTNCQDEVIIVPPACDITILSVESECPGGGGTALVTVTWLAVNTSTNLTVTVGAYSLGVLASAGTATLSVPGDGSTVLVTVFDNNDNNCMEGQSHDLPYCCSEGNANMGIICATCDEYQVYRTRITTNGGTFEVVGVTVNGVYYPNSAGNVATIAWCNDIPDMLDEYAVEFPELTFGGKKTDDYFEFIAITQCCDDTAYEITLHYDFGGALTADAVLLGTWDCATVTAYLLTQAYPTIPCSSDAYETGFVCCDDYCFTATASGAPTAVATDIIEYSFDNITYFTGSFACIDAGDDIYFRRTITYNGGCPDTVITKRIYDVTDCSSYSIETL